MSEQISLSFEEDMHRWHYIMDMKERAEQLIDDKEYEIQDEFVKSKLNEIQEARDKSKELKAPRKLSVANGRRKDAHDKRGGDIDFEWYEKNLKGSVEYEKIRRKYPEAYEVFRAETWGEKKEGSSSLLQPKPLEQGSSFSLNHVLDVNQKIFKQIESGNINREFIFESFKGLGETVEHHGFNPNEKRNLTYQQYFTPYLVVEFITKALNLDSAENVIVFDNSAGMGRMFRYLHPSTRIIGIEKEERAYKVCKALFPNAQIIQDDLINHILPFKSVDVSLINPPFSMHLEKRDSGLYNAQWGARGPKSSVESHIAELEIAIRASDYYVAVILPTTFFTNESTRIFERWIKDNAIEVLRIDLPEDAHAGAFWATTLIIYDTRTNHRYAIREPYHWTVNKLAELNGLLPEWQNTEYYQQYVRKFIEDTVIYQKQDVTLKSPGEIELPKVITPKIPLTGNTKVKVCLNPTNTALHLKTHDLLTSLKVQEYKDSLGERYNKATKSYVSEWWIKARRPEAFYNPAIPEEINDNINPIGDVVFDDQIIDVSNKVSRWLKLQRTPFEQWIQKEDGTWELKFEEDGVCTKYPELYRQQSKKLEKILDDHPLELWNWQKHDVIRMSIKQHTLLAADMGLGKTRMIIALGLMHGCKHNLIITESKLVGQFAGELKQFGCDVNIIEKYSDTNIKHLKQFNLIAYSKIWRKATPSKTFAKALKKRCNFIALDESHAIKANDSKRALACRSMHPKHWCLSTGTPIANYPRNIFSLLVCAFGDGSELFPYGYWNPYIQQYGCTSGTREFRERFVTVDSYISNQFDQTLDKGKRIREFPIVKDIDAWHDMLAPMMIRRCRDEPEVMRDVKIPEPELKEIWVKPSNEHIDYYKLWLDEFAEWFMAELKAELAGGHKMDTIMLLVQIGKLQFVSTIPQSEKIKSDKVVNYNWNGSLTEKQEKIIELATQHINQNKKVIVYSERPELQKLLAEEFKHKGIKALVFTGEQPIPVREEILREFRVNHAPLLLATTTVGGTGLNLPEASVVIFADQSWTPAIHEQAIARVCRPQQKNKPLVYKLFNSGFIDEYMKAMMDVKKEGIDEGIDWQQHTFDPSNWISFRDMSYRYLQQEGYI